MEKWHELHERPIEDEERQLGRQLADPDTEGPLMGDNQNGRREGPRNPADRSTAFLDGLRGLAALFVFVQHYIAPFDSNAHEHGFGERRFDESGAEDGRYYYLASLPFLRIVFNGGNAAVAIFFVLSGYVLSKSPLRLLRNGKLDACHLSLVSSVIRRPIRLYIPPLATSLITALILQSPIPIMEPWPWATPKKNLWAELVNWFDTSFKFFQPFQEHASNKMPWYYFNIVAWTLPIELKGSMLVYLLVFLYALSGLRRLSAVLLLSFTSIVLLQMAWWAMACFIAGLVLAMLDTYSMDTALCIRYLTARGQSILWNSVFIVGYYLLCQPAHAGKPQYSHNTPGWYYLTLLTPGTYVKDKYYRYWQSWGGLLVVYACLRIDWLQRFLHTKPLRYLGKVSFMLYLVHLPFFRIFGDRLSRMLGMLAKDMQGNVVEEPSWFNDKLHIPDIGPAGMSTRFLVALAINLAVTLAVADIGTKLIDAPSVRIGKKLTQWLGLDRKPGRGVACRDVTALGSLLHSQTSDLVRH